MKYKITILLAIGILLLNGCAYFNTFYNAKKYYKLGYIETQKNMTGKVSGSERTNYQKTIEKCAKILEFYPESKYVDDALLLMGKSYFHMGEYVKATRKFLELRTNYPASEYVIEASLWQARSQLQLQRFEEAEASLNALVGRELPGRYKGDAYYYFGVFYQMRDNFEAAVESFEKASTSANRDLRIETLFALGATYDTLSVFDKAAVAYRDVQKYKPLPEVQYRSEYKYGQMRRKEGKTDEAIQVFEALLREERALQTQNNRRIPNLQLEIALCLRLQGNIEESMLAYQDITTEYEKRDQAARAFFELGQISEEYLRDYERAANYYDQSVAERKSSVWADSSTLLKRDIDRLEALVQVVDMYGDPNSSGVIETDEEEIEEDTLTAEIIYDMMEASLANKSDADSAQYAVMTQIASVQFADSIIQIIQALDYQRKLRQNRNFDADDSNGTDWGHWYTQDVMPSFSTLELDLDLLAYHRERYEKKDAILNPELSAFKVEDKDQNLFFLGELYWFRFQLPDSASVQYQNLVNEFPESPYASNALYNLGFLEMENTGNTSNAYFLQLVEDYPQSDFANEARNKMDLPLIKTVQDSILDLFANAEKTLMEDDDPMGALQQYEDIYVRFPENSTGAKSLYSMGWIYDHTLHQPEMAMVYYDSLVAQYPETEYGIRIAKKIELTNQAKMRIEQAIADSIAMTDSLANVVQAADVDSTQSQSVVPDSSDAIPVIPVADDSLNTSSEEADTTNAENQ